MAKSEIIKTQRLIIEPFSEKYLTQKYIDWLNNYDVVRYSEQRHMAHTVESCRKYMESFDNTPNYFWAIVISGEQPRHIGNINAFIDSVNRIADIGILIGESVLWGKGYGYEAWKTVCNYLMEDVGIRKITTGTVAINRRMLALMRKSGMVEDGRRVCHYLLDGNETDVIHMALFNENWKKE